MHRYLFLLIASFFITGCFKNTTDTAQNTSPTGGNKTVDTVQKASTESVKPLEIGVEECDTYFKNMKACIEKISPATAEQSLKSLKTTEEQWKAIPKELLTEQCLKATEAAKASLEPKGCSF